MTAPAEDGTPSAQRGLGCVRRAVGGVAAVGTIAAVLAGASGAWAQSQPSPRAPLDPAVRRAIEKALPVKRQAPGAFAVQIDVPALVLHSQKRSVQIDVPALVLYSDKIKVRR